MRLAVLSDIHGNMLALEAVLADLESVGAVDTIWVLGDLAAMGPRPAECLACIRQWRESFGEKKFHLIKGNTDRYLVSGQRPRHGAKDEEAFKTLAQQLQERDSGFNWTLAQLSFEDYTFLKKLPSDAYLWAESFGPVVGYHGTPGDDEGHLTPETPEQEALDMLLDCEGRLGIGGHIHRQMDRNLGRWRAVNVGSVGYSDDMPGMAQWGLFTFEDRMVQVELRAVPFDVDAVIAELEAVGFPAPHYMARLLREGKTW